MGLAVVILVHSTNKQNNPDFAESCVPAVGCSQLPPVHSKICNIRFFSSNPSFLQAGSNVGIFTSRDFLAKKHVSSL